MFILKGGGIYLLDGHIVCLTEDQVRKFCLKKSKRHKIDADYCLEKMLVMQHKSIRDFILHIEELMHWAFFNDYDNLFAFRRKSK